MSLSLYSASIPVFIRGLENLGAILTKGQAHADARKIDGSVLVNARLAPDMYPLARQVQIASDAAKGFSARVAGVDVPSYPDTEASFADLQARVEKTIGFLKSLSPDQLDGKDDSDVTYKTHYMEKTFTGQSYLQTFAMPNFFFHITTAYDILRHNGVELGKNDYLGQL